MARQISPFQKQALILVALVIVLAFIAPYIQSPLIPHLAPPVQIPAETPLEIPTPAIPTEGPSPTPRPLTFEEMSQLYGPCAVVPTLMYHHIEPIEQATEEGHKWLAVSPDAFHSQMAYLASHGYTTIGMQSLINFFDNGTPLPHKPVMLTFDDGYSDMETNAAPILSEFGLQATFFIPTGLIGNPNYATWDFLDSAPTFIEMANHTWSHRNVLGSRDVVTREIKTADEQLAAHGMNSPKVFAYPYGPSDALAIDILSSFGYKLAFTTTHGSTLCKGQRLDLPRIRIGNGQLSAYGL